MEEKNSYLSADPETIRQIDEKMPPEEELQDLAEFFKVFGDATRLKILVGHHRIQYWLPTFRA